MLTTSGFLGPLAERARAEEKNHRGTEGTEKRWELCLRALCAPVVQTSSKKRGSVKAPESLAESGCQMPVRLTGDISPRAAYRVTIAEARKWLASGYSHTTSETALYHLRLACCLPFTQHPIRETQTKDLLKAWVQPWRAGRGRDRYRLDVPASEPEAERQPRGTAQQH